MNLQEFQYFAIGIWFGYSFAYFIWIRWMFKKGWWVEKSLIKESSKKNRNIK